MEVTEGVGRCGSIWSEAGQGSRVRGQGSEVSQLRLKLHRTLHRALCRNVQPFANSRPGLRLFDSDSDTDADPERAIDTRRFVFIGGWYGQD
jgi:hypothetical protein